MNKDVQRELLRSSAGNVTVPFTTMLLEDSFRMLTESSNPDKLFYHENWLPQLERG
jgi:hypothetical protein